MPEVGHAPWTMPEWMKDYKNVLTWQGAEEKWVKYVEEMFNDRTNIQINAPRAIYSTITQGEVSLLLRMKEKGLLNAVQ